VATELYWVDGPWPDRLAVAPRPRGGDWIENEAKTWKQAPIHAVLSLLTADEERSLELAHENQAMRTEGMEFLSLPIPDRQLPYSDTEVAAILEKLNARLISGKNVVIHCRQGLGRSTLIAAFVLVSRGIDPQTAVNRLRAARGVEVPETPEQRQWIDHYAASFANSK